MNEALTVLSAIMALLFVAAWLTLFPVVGLLYMTGYLQ